MAKAAVEAESTISVLSKNIENDLRIIAKNAEDLQPQSSSASAEDSDIEKLENLIAEMRLDRGSQDKLEQDVCHVASQLNILPEGTTPTERTRRAKPELLSWLARTGTYG